VNLFFKILFIAFVGFAIGKIEGRNITFFVSSDPHYCSTYLTVNRAVIDRMNALPGTDFPVASWGKVETPRGVIASGDLTSGTEGLEQTEWNYFVTDYGLTGTEGRLIYPIYEGSGNRDYWHNSPVVTNGIALRNLSRPGINISNDGLHYSWDWDDVHIINLNLSFDESENFSFLTNDLHKNLKFKGQPIIIYHHYAPVGSAYYNAISNYNVIAIFRGHDHYVEYTEWNGINTYTTPASYMGRFFAVNISNNVMRVAEGDESGSWESNSEKTFNDYPPSNPVLLPATSVGENEFTANWNAISNVSVYIFDVSTNETFCDFVADYQNKNVDTTNETVTGLASEKSYYYRVKATNAFGLSAYSDVSNVITLPEPLIFRTILIIIPFIIIKKSAIISKLKK